jgi:hypothetical protein
MERGKPRPDALGREGDSGDALSLLIDHLTPANS